MTATRARDELQDALDDASSEATRIRDAVYDIEAALRKAETAAKDQQELDMERRKLSVPFNRILDVSRSLVDGGVFDLQDLQQALRDYDEVDTDGFFD